jgi:hypothetical protein
MSRTKDITDQRFGNLVAVRPTNMLDKKRRNVVWVFRCDCGKEIERASDTVKSVVRTGKIPACSHACPKKAKTEQSYKTIKAGDVFGKLEAIHPVNVTARGYRNWLFRCVCGKEIVRSPYNLFHDVRGGHEPSCQKCSRRPGLPIGLAAKNAVLGAYRRNAALRNIPILLSDEDMLDLFAGNCFYCGKQPSQRSKERNGRGSFIYNGIDRLDNAVGYIPGNVVPCCGMCNRNKGAMCFHEFIEWVRLVAEHTKEKY